MTDLSNRTFRSTAEDEFKTTYAGDRIKGSNAGNTTFEIEPRFLQIFEK